MKSGLCDRSFEIYISYFLSLCYLLFYILMAQACQSFELHEHLKLSGVGDCQMWKHRLMFM